MKNLIVSTILLFAINAIASAQDHAECFTPPIYDSAEVVDKIFAEINCINPSITVYSFPNDTTYNYKFIPSEVTPIKYVNVRLHVIQDHNGQNNFKSTISSHLSYLQSIFSQNWGGSVNGVFSNIPTGLYQGEALEYHIPDSKIRFLLSGIHFQ
ncbi:MAG: hypothetical protein KGZ97_02375 [Bacteroidetes bacterium]|nr:hypothetical protein [Bacteroidota bacterium]